RFQRVSSLNLGHLALSPLREVVFYSAASGRLRGWGWARASALSAAMIWRTKVTVASKPGPGRELVQVRWAQRVNISAKTGRAVHKLVPAMEDALAS
ncbi:hypothetical protein ACNJF9_21140, partial [Mycobacterium tuberculosis]